MNVLVIIISIENELVAHNPGGILDDLEPHLPPGVEIAGFSSGPATPADVQLKLLEVPGL